MPANWIEDFSAFAYAMFYIKIHKVFGPKSFVVVDLTFQSPPFRHFKTIKNRSSIYEIWTQRLCSHALTQEHIDTVHALRDERLGFDSLQEEAFGHQREANAAQHLHLVLFSAEEVVLQPMQRRFVDLEQTTSWKTKGALVW